MTKNLLKKTNTILLALNIIHNKTKQQNISEFYNLTSLLFRPITPHKMQYLTLLFQNPQNIFKISIYFCAKNR